MQIRTPSLMDKHKTPLILLFILFTLLQIIFIWHVDVLEYDEAIYMDVARNIRLTGVALRSMGDGVLYAEHTSLYQHLVGVITFATGENIVFLRLLTVFTAYLCVFFTYLIIYTATQNWRNSFVATLLLVINPFFNLYAYFIREEMLMCLFLLMGSYAVLQHEQSKKERYFWIASFLFVCAVLTKEITLLFGVVLGAYILFGPSSWQKKAKELLVLAIPTSGGLLLWGGWVWWHEPLRLQSVISRWILSAAGGQTDFRLGISNWEWLQTISHEVFSYGFIAAFLITILIALWQRNKPGRLVFLTGGYVVFAVGISFFVALKEPRHLIATIPFAAISVGLLPDLAKLHHKIQRNLVEKWVALAMFVVILSMASLWQIPTDARQPLEWWKPRIAYRLFHEKAYYHVLREAGFYLGTQTPPGTKIAVVHEGTVVGYYAKRPYLALYNSLFDDVLATLDGIEYLVYDHPVFTQLSATEIEQVNRYIAEHFTLIKSISDEYRTVQVYQRKG